MLYDTGPDKVVVEPVSISTRSHNGDLYVSSFRTCVVSKGQTAKGNHVTVIGKHNEGVIEYTAAILFEFGNGFNIS